MPPYATLPLTAQPAIGIAPSSWRATARKPKPAADRREHLGQPLLVDLDAVRGREPEHEPDLVQGQHGEVGARDEDRHAQDPVLARERLDQPPAERLAQHGQPRREPGARLAEPGRDGARRSPRPGSPRRGGT